MYKIGDYIVYQKYVYKIVNIKEKYLTDIDYFFLENVIDKSLKVKIPITSKAIRNIMSKEEIDKIISNIKQIDILDINEKNIELEYKQLLNSGKPEDLIKIIKTTYLRNKQRLDSKRKISDKDKNYFEQAEKLLYTEFSVVLNMNFDDTKNYIIQEVERGK